MSIFGLVFLLIALSLIHEIDPPLAISILVIEDLVLAGYLALIAVLGLGRPALADAPDPLVLDPGVACDFGLRIDFSGGHRVERVFTDKNGNPVRFLSAGKGFLETFTK